MFNVRMRACLCSTPCQSATRNMTLQTSTSVRAHTHTHTHTLRKHLSKQPHVPHPLVALYAFFHVSLFLIMCFNVLACLLFLAAGRRHHHHHHHHHHNGRHPSWIAAGSLAFSSYSYPIPPICLVVSSSPSSCLSSLSSSSSSSSSCCNSSWLSSSSSSCTSSSSSFPFLCLLVVFLHRLEVLYMHLAQEVEDDDFSAEGRVHPEGVCSITRRQETKVDKVPPGQMSEPGAKMH